MAVGQFEHLFIGAEGDDVGHGTEGFLIKRAHAGLHAREHGGIVEEVATGAAGLDLCAGFYRVGHDALDPLQLTFADDRPQRHLPGDRVTDRQMAGTLGQPPREFRGNRLLHEDAAGGHADLALVQPRTPGGVVHGQVQVRIIQDDQRVVAAQFQRDFLERAAGQFADAPTHGRRAGELDHLHMLRQAQRLAGFSATWHHLQHASGEACFLEGARDEHTAGERRLRVGLEHHGIARGQRGCHRAHGQDQREIERRNDADDATRNTARVAEPTRRIGQHLATRRQCQRGSTVQDRDGLADFMLALGEDAAGLACDQHRHGLGVPLQDLGGAAQDAGAIPRTQGRPGGLRGRSDGGGRIDIEGIAKAGVGQRLAAGRFRHVACAALGRDPGPVEDLSDPAFVSQQMAQIQFGHGVHLFC